MSGRGGRFESRRTFSRVFCLDGIHPPHRQQLIPSLRLDIEDCTGSATGVFNVIAAGEACRLLWHVCSRLLEAVVHARSRIRQRVRGQPLQVGGMLRRL